ncbi:blue-sensitive opsin-like isoform X2 [Ptychodera flava]|uniref:blue-sensitive opsin-like isoform X2 n=1 Tax=Ptychodera flava TaxID=63121 RepID=UPI003969ED27
MTNPTDGRTVDAASMSVLLDSSTNTVTPIAMQTANLSGINEEGPDGFLSTLSPTSDIVIGSAILLSSRFIDKKNTIIAMVCIWTYSLLWALPPLIGWNRYVPEPCGIFCTLDWILREYEGLTYTVSLFIFIFFIPFSVILLCYCAIVHTTNAQRKAVEMSSKKSFIVRYNMQKRLTKVAIAMTSAFLLSWSPYAALSLWAVVIGGQPPISVEAMTAPSVFAKFSTIYNPILIVVFNAAFRENLRAFFSGKIGLPRVRSGKTTTGSTGIQEEGRSLAVSDRRKRTSDVVSDAVASSLGTDTPVKKEKPVASYSRLSEREEDFEMEVLNEPPDSEECEQ